MRAVSTVFGLLMVLGTIAGCKNDPVHEIDMAVDCDNVCNRYRDCFNTSYNTDNCRSRCHEMVDRDPNAANACDSCLDAASCIGAFGCASECQGILP